MPVYDAVIVGSGFSGLYQLHQLRDQLGLNVLVIEAGHDVGGTWYWNRYPGARCDSESHYYSYSFSKELQAEWRWTERYPEHSEIRRYLEHVAERFDLRRNIRFGLRVTAARWDEAETHWLVETDSGEVFAAAFFITAVGCLSAANVPNIPGLNAFAGEWYHTARWPQEGVNFAGKRVGLVGTGSTGIQAAPVIAEQAAHLTVFQRTANYSIPSRNRKLTDAAWQEIQENYGALREKARGSTNGHPFDVFEKSALEVSEAERMQRYEKAWEVGGLRFRASFGDLLKNLASNQTASDFIREKIRQIVKDPAVAALLTPMDHPFASKRPPIDTDYFEIFNRPNVTLVDVKAAPIEEITAAGLRTSAGFYALDMIVFATGFDALTGPLLAMDIWGAEGHSLREDWAAGPRTYLGLQTPYYPNMFTITGPGSPSVLTNMPVAIEQHTQWITACIAYMRAHGFARIETTVAEAEAWVAEVNAAANATLLPMASSSWYLGANVPGKPRVFMPYAGGMAHYAGICEAVAREGYRGFQLSQAG
jgi:cation diffusion facilitator CzcD-associated flavoprotein CzcO